MREGSGGVTTFWDLLKLNGCLIDPLARDSSSGGRTCLGQAGLAGGYLKHCFLGISDAWTD
eukprot:357381-Chlamydomonas_euryale.AAC.16